MEFNKINITIEQCTGKIFTYKKTNSVDFELNDNLKKYNTTEILKIIVEKLKETELLKVE